MSDVRQAIALFEATAALIVSRGKRDRQYVEDSILGYLHHGSCVLCASCGLSTNAAQPLGRSLAQVGVPNNSWCFG